MGMSVKTTKGAADAPDLSGFPRLVAYRPDAHGDPGGPEKAAPVVATEDNRTPLDAILDAYREAPDPAAVAGRLGTTAAHVQEALAYAVKSGAAKFTVG